MCSGDKLIGLAFRLYGINWGFAVVCGWVERGWWSGVGYSLTILPCTDKTR